MDEQSKAEVLVGEQCLAVKQEIQVKEQVLLREIYFEVAVEDSQKYLLNFAKSLQLDPAIVHLAAFLCNDSLVYTNLCLRFIAAEVAAGCIVAAVRLMEGRKLLVSKIDTSAFSVWTGLSQKRVERVAFDMIDALQSCLQ